ncbi:MAG: hypothetical protein C4547_16890 [Phycisphaerales bacterium]|nr:MAG: hypothetical protein C4547_16890 [Phycisphaerales bacterium]
MLHVAFWLALLLLHGAGVAYAALGVASGAVAVFDGVVRMAMLLASSVYFALKIADVHCFRLTPGWRSGLAAVVAVGLIHIGVARRAARGESGVRPASVGVVLALGAAGHAALVRRWILELGRACSGAAQSASKTGLKFGPCGPAALCPRPFTQLAFLMSVRSLRAPPLA